MNSFGQRLTLSTFGESHGACIGGVLDGVPAGLKIDMDLISQNIKRRGGGSTLFTTQRKEEDNVEILSGVMDGISTGTSIGIIVQNNSNKSSDYENIKDIFRPGHADYTYFAKYGIRDYKGGGRSSARESVLRVAGGSIAAMILQRYGIEVQSGLYSVGEIISGQIDFKYAKQSDIFCLDKDKEDEFKNMILSAKNSHDSIGGIVKIQVTGMLKGLGEPLFDKLDGRLGDALLGLNGVKAIEIGSGTKSSLLKGSQNNDEISQNGFITNQSGGILGGISNGENLEITIYFKPTPSIFLPQKSIDTSGNEVICELKGRHDPCIAIRGSVVAEMMVNLVLADLLLLNTTATIKSLDKIYGRAPCC